MATHSSVLAWRIPGTEEPGGLPSMRSHRVRHDWSDLAALRALGNKQGVSGVEVSPIVYLLCAWCVTHGRCPLSIWRRKEGLSRWPSPSVVSVGGKVAWNSFVGSESLWRCKQSHFLMIIIKSESLSSTQCLGERGTKHWADELAPHASLPAVLPQVVCPHLLRCTQTHIDTC